MTKLAPALIDPTTDEGLVDARNIIYAHLIEALTNAPASVRNLVKRCKMHEFFRLYRPGQIRGAHWHTPAVPYHLLFVRYQHYRLAEAVFEQCRYAFYPELMPDKYQLLTDPIIDTDTVGQLADWGGAWTAKVVAHGSVQACIEIDQRYPEPAIVDGDWAIVPREGGEFLLAKFIALRGSSSPGYIIKVSQLGMDLYSCLVINQRVNQPFFIYTPPQ